jgi:Cofactor assembly of complex C subunit B, CCB2/CCB4
MSAGDDQSNNIVPTTAAKVALSAGKSLDKDSIDASERNPIDATLSWLTSDVGSLILGGAGLLLLLLSRFMFSGSIDDGSLLSSTGSSNEDFTNALSEETRANLLAVFAIGTVLLNGLSQLDVQSALAEQVVLQGPLVAEPIFIDDNGILRDQGIKEQIAWTLSSVVAATPASTAILLVHAGTPGRWKPMAYVGVVHPNLAVYIGDNNMAVESAIPAKTPIMDRFLTQSIELPPGAAAGSGEKQRSESFLPTLQALPGKTEFTTHLLPVNTQAALLLPLLLLVGRGGCDGTENNETGTDVAPATHTRTRSVLLLGSNQARSFTPRDIAWCQTVVARLEQCSVAQAKSAANRPR